MGGWDEQFGRAGIAEIAGGERRSLEPVQVELALGEPLDGTVGRVESPPDVVLADLLVDRADQVRDGEAGRRSGVADRRNLVRGLATVRRRQLRRGSELAHGHPGRVRTGCVIEPGMIEQVAGLLERRQGQLGGRQSPANVMLIGRQLVDVGRAETLVNAKRGRQRGTVSDQIVTLGPALGYGR